MANTTSSTNPTLKGHQIIGELRPAGKKLLAQIDALKGHQIIGELRPITKRSMSFALHILKGHQIIGELRHPTAVTTLAALD